MIYYAFLALLYSYPYIIKLAVTHSLSFHSKDHEKLYNFAQLSRADYSIYVNAQGMMYENVQYNV